MSLFDRALVPLPELPELFDWQGVSCRLTRGPWPSVIVALLPRQEIEINPAALLWKDEAATLRSAAVGMVVMRGPARLGLSLGVIGQAFPVPVLPGDSVQVRAGHFLFSVGAERRGGKIRGLTDRISGGSGASFDSFRAGEYGATVWVQSAGGVLERSLADGEALDVRAEAFLVKDESVQLETLISGDAGDARAVAWPCLRLTGPGRVAVQSGQVSVTETAAPASEAAPHRSRMFGIEFPLRGKR